MKWLEPTTSDEINHASILKKSIIISPIAFVSEHVETLVELDIEYVEIAKKHGAQYLRARTLGINDEFIEDLAKNIKNLARIEGEFTTSSLGARLCPEGFCGCIFK
jgi:ferrochelatase